MKSPWFICLVVCSNVVSFVIAGLAATFAWNAFVATTVPKFDFVSSPSMDRRTQECCACGKPIWHPAPGTSWQIQFSGTINTSVNVTMYDIDLFDTAQSVIDKLHKDGRIVICYFSAGSYEDWRPDKNKFPASVLGSPLKDWPGEQWLNIRNLDDLGPIMKARLDLAVTKKCDGVDPDNVDGYQNENGVGLTSNDQLVYNKFLATEAHARGLSIGLKNDLNQIDELVEYFDWALNEQCWYYKECAMLEPFIKAGKAVFGIEYVGTPSKFCPPLNAMKFSVLKKNLALNAFRIDCAKV